MQHTRRIITIAAAVAIGLGSAGPLRAAITDDLVVHLKFDDTLADSSGKNHNGAAVGTVPFVEGLIGKGISFSSMKDSSSFNYVTLGAPPDLDFGTDTDFSISFWAKLTPGSWTGDPAFVSNKDWLSGGNQGYVISTDGDGRLQWNLAGPPTGRKDYDGPGGLFNDGAWHHVVETFQRQGEALTYVDGVEVDGASRSLAAGANNVNTPSGLATNVGQDGTGRYTDGGGVGIQDGQIDDVGIWRRVLTASEVLAIYNAGLEVPAKDLSTVAADLEPLLITAQPAAATPAAGEDVALRVVVRGSGPITYLWKKGNTPIEGATTASLILTNVQPNVDGDYTAVVTGPLGSLTSDVANLTVLTDQPPAIWTPPGNRTGGPGAKIEFTVIARGLDPLTYQWLKAGNPVAGATGSTLTIPSAKATDAGIYSVTVKAANGLETTSIDATLTIVTDIKDRLVAHLKFDGNYDDSSTRGNHGSAMGEVPFVPGKIGTEAVHVSADIAAGVHNYVTLGVADDLQFSTDIDFSVSFWTKFTLWDGDPSFIANKDWDSGGNIGYVVATDNDGRLQWNWRQQSPSARQDYDGPPHTIDNGEWHHIVVTFQRGGDGITYIDGAQVNATPLGPAGDTIDPGLPTNIGEDGAGDYGSVFTDAAIDDVGIWRRVVTAPEVQEIYSKGLLGLDLVAPPPPLTITTEPASQTVSAGADVSFKVVAAGTPPLTYQWTKAGQPITGATTDTLNLSNVQAGDAAAYAVVVRNSGGPKTSANAVLTVKTDQPPTITTQPANATVNRGASVSFTVVARGAEPLTYAWRKEGIAIAGQTSSTLNLSNVQKDAGGKYTVAVTSGTGVVAVSGEALLTVISEITAGLVAHLTFDTDLMDSSGHGNNGTAVGSPTLVAGKVGAQALSFSSKVDGTSFNYVTLGAPADLNFGTATDFSVSFWARLGAWAGDPGFIGNKDWNSGGNQGWIVASHSDGRVQWNIAGANRTRKDYDGPAGTFTGGNWRHVVVTFSRTSDAITYLDGVPVSTNAVSPGVDSVDTAVNLATNIGQDGTGTYTDGNSVGVTEGAIDDVGIWRRVVTADEVADIYRKGQAGVDLTGKLITDDLVAHLTFDSDLKDSSGRGNNGTAVGSPTLVAGKVGAQALSYSSKVDGTSFNYVTLGAPADLNFGTATDFSVSFWARLGAWAGDPGFIGNKDWNSGGNQGWIIASHSDGRVQWNIADTSRTRKDYDGPAGTFTGGNWRHVVVTFSRASDAITYLDGVPVSTNSAILGSVDTAVNLATNIGQDGTGTYTDGNSVGVTDGAIDDVGIWRRVLGAAEVGQIYAKGQAGVDFTGQVSEKPAIGSIVAAAGNVTITWQGGAGIRLQSTASLSNPNWQDVANSAGASSATVSAAGNAAFFRLAK